MQDLNRFERLYDNVAEAGDEVRAEIMDDLDILQDRFLDLRSMVYRCVTDGWTVTDLLAIKEWVENQEDLTQLDLTTIGAIELLMLPQRPPMPQTRGTNPLRGEFP